jgi:hypothetical protein
MGLASGSVSVSRYQILLPPGVGLSSKKLWDSWSTLNQMVEPFKAPPLTLDKKLSPEVAGWVFPNGQTGSHFQDDDLPPDHHWDLEMCQIDTAILLRLRLEKRQVPNQLLQFLYKNEIYKILQKEGQAPNPKEKRQLKQDLQNQLAKRALPTIQFVDGLWWDRGGELWVITTGQRLRSLFIETFTKTFLAPVKAGIIDLSTPLVGLKAMGDDQEPQSEIASEALRLLSSTVPVSMAHS